MIQAILNHFSIKSLIGYLVAFFVLFCQLFGVDVHDLAPSLSIALANFANAAAALVPLGFALWGHIQLAQKHQAAVGPTKVIPLSSTPPSVKAIILLACAGAVCSLSACSDSASTDTTVTTTSASTGTTTVTTPTAMQTWVTTNWQIFYYLGYGGAEAYVTFGVNHNATKQQLAQDVIIGHGAIKSLDTNSPLSASAIESDIGAAGGNVGTKSTVYANLGSLLSGPLATLISYCGGDVKAALDALNYFSQGMADYANTLLPASSTTWHAPLPRDVALAQIDCAPSRIERRRLI